MKNLSILFLCALSMLACNSSAQNNELESSETTASSFANVSSDKSQKIGSLNLLCSTDNSYYFLDEAEEYLYLYTELKADFYEKSDFNRTPLNLAIVIDRSGSMAGDKLSYAKEAAIFAVSQLNSDDMVSIVTYEDGVQLVQAPIKADNKELIIQKIKNIQTGGSTFLSGGMIKGFEAVEENFDNEFLNRVFLMSDGLANQGIVEHDELVAIASRWKETKNISLSTFGIGIGFNEDLMTDLAEFGSGNYYFIGEPAEIPNIFQKEMNGLLSLVAKDVKLKIKYPSGSLSIKQVFGYKYEANEDEILVNFGEMYSEERKAVLVKFALNENPTNSLTLSSEIQFIDLTDESKELKTLRLERKVQATQNKEVYENGVDLLTMQQVTLFEANYKMEQAAIELDLGNYDKARSILQENDEFIQIRGDKFGYTDEINKQKEVNGTYSISIKDYENMSNSDQQYIQKSNKMYNYEIKKKKE